MKNIELKARCADLRAAATIAEQLGAALQWRREQVDTYFTVGNGRLKLRESENLPAELIGYNRPNEAHARASEYTIYSTENGAVLKDILADTLNVLVTVHKVRTLYLYENVRIHLDEVKHLGSFIEFEAVIADSAGIPESTALVNRFKKEFKLRESDIVPYSYSDMLLSAVT
jgi:predicted adenylyl cyclase CyaB